MDGFDYISILLFVLVIIFLFALRRQTKEKDHYEKKAIIEERLKEALEQELKFPNIDWQEYEEIEKSFEKFSNDLWNKKGIEGYKQFKRKYYDRIISFYKSKQGR